MSPRTVMVVALALVCGVLAVVGVRTMQKPALAAAPPAVETLPVLYAAASIRRGDTIGEAMVEVREVPKAQAPEGAMSKPADAVGRAAHFPMLKGDVVSDAKLSPKGSGAGMAALIRPGMRAFTIQTPTLSSTLAGFLLPGNRVDVLMTISIPETADEMPVTATITLLENVEILAVHTTVDIPSNNKIDLDQARSITLLVRPEDASLLDLGQDKGTLQVSLRNVKDEATIRPKGDATASTKSYSTLADLKGPREKKARPAAPATAAAVAAPRPPAPEFREYPLQIRTLRGTSPGADTMTVRMRTPAPTADAGPPPEARFAEATPPIEPPH